MGEVLDLTDADIVMMGGGSDRDQLAVAHELLAQKDKVAAYVEDSGSLLAICGSYQLLGRSYYMGEDRIEGLGIIAAETVRGSDRLIGNVAVKTVLAPEPFVGFENHGGRTLLDADATPLGTSVVAGTGNNADDGFEGLIYKGVIGTYLHGPGAAQEPRTRRLAHRPRPRAPRRRAGHSPAPAQAPRRHLRACRPRRRHEAPPLTPRHYKGTGTFVVVFQFANDIRAGKKVCYTLSRCPHRLAAKDATLSRWISRVRIPLGAPFEI